MKKELQFLKHTINIKTTKKSCRSQVKVQKTKTKFSNVIWQLEDQEKRFSFEIIFCTSIKKKNKPEFKGIPELCCNKKLESKYLGVLWEILGLILKNIPEVFLFLMRIKAENKLSFSRTITLIGGSVFKRLIINHLKLQISQLGLSTPQ